MQSIRRREVAGGDDSTRGATIAGIKILPPLFSDLQKDQQVVTPRLDLEFENVCYFIVKIYCTLILHPACLLIEPQPLRKYPVIKRSGSITM